MAIFTATDPVTGRSRQFNIAGETPTEQEQQQISSFFGQQAPASGPSGFEAAVEAERQRLMASMPQPEVPEDDGTAFGRGFRRGIPQTLSSLAAGAGALGFEDVQDYLSGIASEQEMKILQENPELLNGVDFRDIRGLNSFLSYVGELAGEQAPLIGGTLLAGGAAALAGASAPVAAVIGTAAASGPLLFGSNVQRRAEVLGINPEDLASEDVSRAALAAIGQTALEAATNVLLVGRLGAGAASQIVENASAEAIAEVGQQALERAQAGLDVDSPDAYEEYLQSAVAGATLGGVFGGAGAIAGARGRSAARDEELNQDQTEEALRNTLEAERAQEGRAKELQEEATAPTAEEDLAAKFVSDITGGAIALPAPQSRIAETEQNQLLKRIQREQATNFRRIRLSQLELQERIELAKAREAAGLPRRLTTTLQEIQAVLGSDVAAREAAKQKPASAAAGQGVYTVPDNAKFNKDQLQAAIARVQATGKVNFPIVRKALADVTEGNVPNEVTRSVLDELVNRGLIRRIDKNGKKGYELEPTVKPVAEQAPIARERRELDRLEQEVKQAQERRDMLAEDIRRVEQTGTNLQGRKMQPATVRRNLQRAEKQLAALQNQTEQARQRVRGLNLQSTVPTRERVAGRADEAQARARMEALEQEIIDQKKRLSNLRRIVARAGDRATNQQRENLALQEQRIDRLRVQREKLNARLLNPSAAVQVKPEETAGQQARIAAGFEAEAGTAATTPEYNAAYATVMQNLRKRLDGMGLKDIAIEFDENLLTEQGADGSYKNKLIKLASGIYDPDLTEQQLTDRMAAVMDHEVIHALRGMNLFSDGEWQSLSRAAAQQKYVAIKNGKPTERSYSYLDRARKMYPDESPEIQVEEAIAEMFRQHTGGTKRFTGRPGNLLQRIVNFFKSVFRANEDSGFQRPSDIFERAQRGEVAARRAQAEPEVEARQSRRAQVEDLFEAMGDRGALAEYPGIGRAVDQYINQSDTAQKLRSNFYDAINDPDYPAYKRDLQVNLQRTYGDRDVPVSRVEGYADPRMQKVRKNYNIPQDDVFLVANPDERELIVRLPDGSIRSARARDVADVRRIAVSNPGGEWLANKRRNVEADMAQAQAGTSDAKGLFGSTTAYTANQGGGIAPVTLPLWAVRYLSGANDERPRPGQYKYDELLASVQERGFTDENPIMIGVNHRGQAYITEGNNRVAIADRFGVPTIQAEVRWFNGGEEVDSNWSPSAVREKVAKAMGGGEELLSRRVQLPESLKDISILDLYDSAGNFRDLAERRPDGRRIARRKEDAIRMMQQGRKRIFNQDNPEDVADLARLMAAEAEAALETDRNAIGWYGTTLAKAKNVLGMLHPEILTDPGANAAMDYAIAVTSNGLAVVDNFEYANRQYENWQQTGRFLEEGYGKQGQSMINAFTFYNALKDRGLSDADIATYLSQETTPGQLRKDPIIRELGLTVDSKEFAATPVRVSYIIGPKIGQGFYQNLRGNFEPLTMDRWWMRMFNRMTGRPFVPVKDETIQNNVNRVLAALQSNQITDNEARIRDAAMDNLGIDILTPENVKDLGIEINRLFQREFTRLPKEQRPAKTELFLAADTLAKNATDQLQEDPRGPGDRQFMRDVTNQAREILRTESNIDITNADIQALLWYAEKRLWDAYGVRKGRGEDNDYVDGAIALLRQKGFTDGQIAEALPAGDRYRIDPRLSAAGQDGGVRGQAAGTGADGARLSRRLTAPTESDTARDAGDRATTSRPLREIRTPTEQPAAEAAATDLEPVTAEDLKRITELGPEFFRRPGWATISVEAPNLTEQEIARQNMLFKEQLDFAGIPYIELDGSYLGEPESSYLIIAPRSTAELYAKRLNQESILTNEGLVYTKRPIATTKATGRLYTGEAAKAQRSVSRIRGTDFFFSAELSGPWPGDAIFPENTYERTDRPQLPIRKSDNLVELFHWSDQMLTEVDPAFAGTGPLVGAERRRGARLGFFGINPRNSQRDPGTGYVKEGKLGSVLHRALVDPNDLYPWVKDPLDLKENLTTVGFDAQTAEVEQRIRDAGYRGYYVEDDGNVRNPSAPLGNVAAMFEPVKVEPVEGERLSRRVMFSVAQQMSDDASGTNNMTAIQKQVTQYTDIADWLGRAVGVVVRKEGRAQEIADKFIQKTQDSFIPVARMIKELKDRGLTIMDTIDPYLQQQLSKSRAGARIDERKRGIYKQAADAIKGINVSPDLKQGLINVSRANATKGEGLAKYYFDRLGSDKLAVADIYLYAQHALERNAYVRQIDPANQSGSGMSDAEAQALLDFFNNNLSESNKSAIARVDRAIKNIVRDTNGVRIEGDLIPEDVLNVEYNKKGVRAPQFEHYVPLRGVFDDDATADYGDSPAGKRFTVRGREDRRILGRRSDEYGADILANLLFQNTNSIIRAEQNQVALALADLIESNADATKGYGRILEKLPQRRILNANGSVQYTTDQDYKNDPNVVIAKRNGEEIIIDMEDANLAGAFNGKNVWNAGHANVILRGMAKVNRYLSNIVTSWNPEFVISNFSRDIQNAGVNISEFDLPGLRRDVVRNIPKALAGLKRAIRDGNFDSEWAQIYEQFALAGGQSAANPMNTLADQVDQVESLIKDFGEGGTLADLKRNGAKVFKFLEDYNTVVENAVRLTTYDALRKRGFSEARAAQAARGVTVDFTKTGDMGQFMNSLYLFYNAALQGSFFMFRAAARSKRVRRVLAGAIAMGIVSDMVNSMVSGEDEAGVDEYDKIPDYILEHNWVIMLPEGLAPSGRRYLAIPMPYGLNFFYNTGRSISRAGRGGYEVDQAAKSITGTFLEVINPLGGTEHFLNFAAPTIADPFISLYGTNIDFTGRDIRREAFPGQQVARSHLYWNNTSPTAIAFSQAMNGLTGGTPTISGWADISPNTLEFWFEYITGGAGRFVQRTAELPLRISEAQSNEDIIREVPLMRRVFGSISSREDLGTYIRNRDRILEARSEFRDAREARDRDRVAAARERFADELRIAERVYRIEQQRRQITRRMNEIRDNPRMSEERKRDLLDRLDAQQQRVILNGLRIMRGED